MALEITIEGDMVHMTLVHYHKMIEASATREEAVNVLTRRCIELSDELKEKKDIWRKTMEELSK